MRLHDGGRTFEDMKRNILVWDLPTRLFHWTLAGSFLGAYAIAIASDDDAAIFVAHMLLGGVAAFAVALRILWGFVGSRYARFASFIPGVRSVIAYARSVAGRGGTTWVGHNPGSSVAIYGMLLATLGTALTGALMGTYGEALEELHEVLAHGLFALAAIHVAGVVVHALRRRDGIASSMVDGRKQGEPAQGIRSSHPLVAGVFVGLTALWAAGLVRGYDAGTGTVRLPIVGAVLPLGEAEGAEEGGREDDDDDAREEPDDD